MSAKITTAADLAARCKDLAQNHKTLYIMGCFGAPMNDKNKARYVKNNAYNRQAARTRMIQTASADTFGFDCVCMIKGLLWGWTGDMSKTYGGAAYNSNGVPDINADTMISKCSGVSTDFSCIEVGEAVWLKGHIGVYIGDGLAVECSPRWANGVQITACNCTKAGYNRRNWTKHGKLPYVIYAKQQSVPTKPATGSTADTAETIWKYLIGQGLSECGAAGLMGNLYAESALKPTNLQNSYEKKLGMTDAEYTAAVDNGSYTNFAKDAAGYGLAQWTYSKRKQDLLQYAQNYKASIGDLDMQLSFLWKELGDDYASVLKILKSATSIRVASDAVLTKFERPANQSESVKDKRAQYGQCYYDQFSGAGVPYDVRVTASALNIRKGPGTNFASVGQIRDNGIYTIVAEANGTGATKWGQLEGGALWISLDYVTRDTSRDD